MTPTTKDLLARRRRDDAVLAWYRLIRVFRKSRRHVVEPIRHANLSGGQFDLLLQIGREEGTNQQSCAERLGVTKGNVTQLLDRLEERGLVVRQREGRSNSLFLTDAGHALIADVVPAHDEGARTVLGGLDREELRQLSRLLRKVDRALE